MPLHVAVVMDPIGSILIAKDTSFRHAARGPASRPSAALRVPGGLGAAGGRAIARMAPLSVRDDPAGWFTWARRGRRRWRRWTWC
jgi:glutathione synthase